MTLLLYCQHEHIYTRHKLIGLCFVCLSCEILAQMDKDNDRVWERIATRDERTHGKKKETE